MKITVKQLKQLIKEQVEEGNTGAYKQYPKSGVEKMRDKARKVYDARRDAKASERREKDNDYLSKHGERSPWTGDLEEQVEVKGGSSKREFDMGALNDLDMNYYLDIQTDNDGQFVIYTGLTDPEY